MAKKDTTNKEVLKELAYALFMTGDKQNEIAVKVGISRQTVNKWIHDGSWAERRAAKTVSRKEIVTNMLAKLDEKVSSGEWSPDEICKAANAIEKIDRKTNIVTIIEVFSAYNRWLVARMQLDPELTPELVKIMNRYQDMFIGEKFSSVEISSID